MIALQHRDFRFFIGGLFASSLGTQFTSVAMAWQVYLLTNSPLDIGLVALARGLPQMALLLFGGMLADAFDRRRLMMITQFGQLWVAVGLTAMSWTGTISAPALYAAAGLLGLFNSVETPARQAIIPNLVPRDHLTNALALHGVQRNVGSIAGPSVAGILLAFADPGWCYVAEGVSRVLMIASLTGVKSRGERGPAGRRISFGSLGEGLRFVLGQPVVLGIMLLDFGANIFGSARALLPVYAKDILLVGAPGLGLLYAATSLGAPLGAAAMAGLSDVRRAGVWVLIGQAMFALCTAAFAISGHFWLSLLLLAGAGLGDTIAAVLRGSIVQLLTPDPLRGRVSSVNALFSNGGPQMGQFRSGAVAEVWGAEVSALSGGLVTLAIVAAAAAIAPLRNFEMAGEKERTNA